jgi:hypothetical protein
MSSTNAQVGDNRIEIMMKHVKETHKHDLLSTMTSTPDFSLATRQNTKQVTVLKYKVRNHNLIRVQYDINSRHPHPPPPTKTVQ